MEKKGTRILTLIFIVTIIIGVFPRIALGQIINLEIINEPSNISQGEEFTITLRFSSEKDAIGALNANISYDKEYVEYLYGGGNISQFGNGIGKISDSNSSYTNVLEYSFTFQAKQSGETNLTITDSELIGLETGNLLGNPSKSITLYINKKQEKPPIETPNPREDPIEISEGGKIFYIAKDYPIEELPRGFKEVFIDFKGDKVKGARDNTNQLTLLYIYNEELKAQWYIVDNTSYMLLYQYIPVKIENEFSLVPIDIKAKDYAPVNIPLNNIPLDVLKSNKDDSNGFYLVKAINNKGESGYYFYHQEENTLQKALVNKDNIADISNVTYKPLEWITIVLGFVTFILFVLVIVFLVSLIKSKNKI